jgi:hypothetical protein
MSAYNRTFRIECEATRRGTLVDQRTDQMPSVIRGESAEWELALFQSGVMVHKENISSVTVLLVNENAVVLVEWTISGTGLNASLSPGQWRRGTSHLCSFILQSGDTTALAAGRYTLLVKGWLTSSPPGTNGVVFFAEGEFDLVETPEGGLPSAPPTPGPPTSWTKAEADARFATKATESDVNAAEVSIGDLQVFVGMTLSPPHEDQKMIRAAVAQSLTSGEKTQARSNIGAALADAIHTASVAGGGTYTPDWDNYTMWDVTLTGNITMADGTGTPKPGRRNILMIRQDATGNRKVNWGAGWYFPTYAAINPAPNAVTIFEVTYVAVPVSTWRTIEIEPVGAPRPDIDLNTAVRMTVSGSTISTWYEWMNGLALAVAGGTATYATLNNRSGADLTGALHYTFTPPRMPSTSGGIGVAVVFDSRGGSTNQFLARCVCMGIEVAYNSASGLYIAGVGASAGNRCALPFTPAEATPKIFIGTILAAGGGLALDQSGNIAYLSSAAMATPTAGTEYLGSNAGANYWTGRFHSLAIFTRALSWAEMVALRRQLSLEIGI